MLFFNPNTPVIQCKQTALDVQDLRGLLNINIRVWKLTLFSAIYTRVDQAILLWAILTLAIFSVAQFWPMSWKIQSVVWSSLTTLGVIGMCSLTHFWATVERLSWVIWMWASLVILGLLVTNVGIFFGVGWVLINLCSIWLGISSVGYLLTALGLQSRTFLVATAIHLVGIGFIHLVPGWLFLTTGFIMGGTLWLLSELQWDMRPPIEPSLLTIEEREFNQRQQRIRNRHTLH